MDFMNALYVIAVVASLLLYGLRALIQYSKRQTIMNSARPMLWRRWFRRSRARWVGR